jgi:hypothetical protein
LLKILLFFLISNSHAYFEVASKKVTDPEMNGIKFKDYKNFPEKWKLVTVRYRQDSNEMRFTYANEVAWKAMKSLSPNYPDGAAFGKVAFIAEPDPGFTSSLTPVGTRRYQLMIKDKKIYKTSDGWGYALYDSSGQLFNEDMKIKTEACIACHRAVPERDFVFSRPVQIELNSQFPRLEELKKNKKAPYSFEKKGLSSFQISIPKDYRPQSNTVESLTGEIQKKAFSGTLDEVIPLLVENSKAKSTSSILYLNNKNFSLVVPQFKSDKCNQNQRAYKIYILFNGVPVRQSEFCNL